MHADRAISLAPVAFPIKVRGVWDRITRTSCRWHQAVSRDGGNTWDVNWWMDWTRV